MKNEIAIEDIAVMFVSQFAKDHPDMFTHTSSFDVVKGTHTRRNRFLRMNYKKRRALIEKTLDNIESLFGK